MAGASLFDCLEQIHFGAEGRADFFGEPKLHEIAAFPLRAHIHGRYFWNFADCDAKPALDGERLARFGTLVKNERLFRLGAYLEGLREDPWNRNTPQMSRVLDRLFADLPESSSPDEPNETVVLPALQV